MKHRSWVPPHIRNGRFVKGHWRSVMEATFYAQPDEFKAEVDAFDALPPNAPVHVFHGTTKENAALIKQTMKAAYRPRGDVVSSVSAHQGLYVAPTQRDAARYAGKDGVVIEFIVPRHAIRPSPEARGKTTGGAFYHTFEGAYVEPGTSLLFPDEPIEKAMPTELLPDVKNLSATKRRTLWRLVQTAVDEAWSVERLAREIKQRVGLNDRQTTALANYQAKLKEDGVPPGKARRLSEQYARKQLSFRAATIAATEKLREEQAELLRAAPLGSRKQWITHKDERTCPVCRPLHRKSFELGDDLGGFTHPPAHPNCRCELKIIGPKR